MYEIELLDLAVDDMREAGSYVAGVLANPAAARRLVSAFETGIRSLAIMPYRCRVFATIPQLEHEYRALLVEGWLVLYRIEEEPLQKVIIVRIVYGRADTGRFLVQAEGRP